MLKRLKKSEKEKRRKAGIVTPCSRIGFSKWPREADRSKFPNSTYSGEGALDGRDCGGRSAGSWAGSEPGMISDAELAALLPWSCAADLWALPLAALWWKTGPRVPCNNMHAHTAPQRDAGICRVAAVAKPKLVLVVHGA